MNRKFDAVSARFQAKRTMIGKNYTADLGAYRHPVRCGSMASEHGGESA